MNTNNNLIAIDVLNPGALDKLLLITETGGILVRAYVPGCGNTIAGVVRDVDRELMEQDFVAFLSSMEPNIQFCRF